ncbi:MAG: hypothetical protein P8I94_01715 [Emcibacteraceae bacterium]|nr:hypothetical protein [Emcibacteraceae bacterium]
MNMVKYTLAVIASYIVMGIAGVIGAAVAADQMISIMDISRGEVGNAEMLPYGLLGYLLITIFFTYIYVVGRQAGDIKEGAKFGAMFGIMMSGMVLVNYSIFPFTATALIADMLINVFVYILGGITVSLIYKPKDN